MCEKVRFEGGDAKKPQPLLGNRLWLEVFGRKGIKIQVSYGVYCCTIDTIWPSLIVR